MTDPYLIRFNEWPATVLSALRLNGTVLPCGPGFRPLSWPDTPHTRCLALAGFLHTRNAACNDTAAWVWGALRSPGEPLHFTTRSGRVRNAGCGELNAYQKAYTTSQHQYRLQSGDLVLFEEFAVTSRVRTVFDLLRGAAPLNKERAAACRLLLNGGLDRQALHTRMRAANTVECARATKRLQQIC